MRKKRNRQRTAVFMQEKIRLRIPEECTVGTVLLFFSPWNSGTVTLDGESKRYRLMIDGKIQSEALPIERVEFHGEAIQVVHVVTSASDILKFPTHTLWFNVVYDRDFILVRGIRFDGIEKLASLIN